MRFTGLYFVVGLLATIASGQLQTVYEYFGNENGNPSTGLVAANQEFTLNGKYIRIISGAIHYFRVHPDLWRDRLRKLRATGANTVETYVSWNLHEPEMDQFDFGNGSNDFSEFMDIRRYIQIAQEEDLLVLLRPGPYICSEWDYGGLPSWLQRDPNMRVRENYQPYLDRVKIFLDQLIPLVADLQFTQGGPIIAVQIENEYNSFDQKSKLYLEWVRQIYQDNGLDCLFFTSDSTLGSFTTEGSLEGVLQTANFQSTPNETLGYLQELQPDMPVMAMEFWSGWFNHWFDPTQATSNPDQFREVLSTIFSKFNGSVNFYMFHGGTNFGFMAGGNTLDEAPYIGADITSYDYDAPLSEAGEYTAKYEIATQLIFQYENPKLLTPLRPAIIPKVAYPTLTLQNYLSYNDIIDQVPATHKVQSEVPVSMENLPINNMNGQSYGYVIYRKTAVVNNGDVYRASWPRDFAELLVDGELVETGFQNAIPDYWLNNVKEFPLSVDINGNHTVDLLVENLARVNFGGRADFVQQKGIAPIHSSKIEINDAEITDLEIIALEFKSAWVKGLQNWKNVTSPSELKAPVLIQSIFTINGTPADTFLDMSAWHKGIVFINGFNLGRYFKAGPQQNLYIPAPLLKTGENTVTIFEQFQPSNQIVFTDTPNLG